MFFSFFCHVGWIQSSEAKLPLSKQWTRTCNALLYAFTIVTNAQLINIFIYF